MRMLTGCGDDAEPRGTDGKRSTFPREMTNMNTIRNEIEPPPVDDDFDFADLGPEDLELIRGSEMVEEDDDYEEWEDDPWEEMRREEQRQWLRDLVDPDDPRERVVELGRFRAAVIQDGVLYVVSHEKWTRLGPCRARGKSDDEIRKKVKTLLPFL